jgi:hypothetical protein
LEHFILYNLIIRGYHVSDMSTSWLAGGMYRHTKLFIQNHSILCYVSYCIVYSATFPLSKFHYQLYFSALSISSEDLRCDINFHLHPPLGEILCSVPLAHPSFDSKICTSFIAAQFPFDFRTVLDANSTIFSVFCTSFIAA